VNKTEAKTMQQTTILGFLGTEEFDAIPGSNTFRIGHRYDQILRKGDEVVIRDDDLHQLRGTAVVSDVWTGSLRNMLQEHGDENHHLTREHSEVRRADLKCFLEDVYRELGYDVDDTTPFTVIYFEEAEEDSSGAEGEIETEEEPATSEDDGAGKVEATPTPAASETEPTTQEPQPGTVFSGAQTSETSTEAETEAAA
jgi:hypothetical protein